MSRTSKYQQNSASQNSTLWNAGLYVRLSREDGDKIESESISSQKSILQDFVSVRPDIDVTDIYVDDGWSGTDFDRPDFCRMLDDIRKKRINCVIVKDLSRFGRNYVEAGKYLEVVFPMFKIRFIAVNDNIDSFGNPTSMNTVLVPFKNILNDEYCRDISTKVRTALDIRRKQGKFIGSFALYGYKKDPADRHKLITDGKAAEIVRLIYDKFLRGDSIIGIARYLNEEGIPCPAAYKRQTSPNYRCPLSAKSALWCDSSVRRILTNEMYIGNMVQKKNQTISYKVHVAQGLPKDKWIVVEGTHEGIISKEEFEMVQSVLRRDTRVSPKTGKLTLFAGFLRCPDCGRAMQSRTVTQPYKTYRYYACGTYRKMHSRACTKHMIRADVLEEVVLTTLNQYIRLAADFKSLAERVKNMNAGGGRQAKLQTQIKEKEEEVDRLKGILLDLYPDFKSGLLTKEQYLALKERYEAAVLKAQRGIEELQKQAKECADGLENNKFLNTFLKYRGFEKLTREILTELVEVIYIHEGGGVEIHLKCQDAFALALEYADKNRALISEAKPNTPSAADVI